ncbi:hypothetical protein DICVIV_11356 [Dictyocaulus viviparus]|uniref:HEAT repeat protein n=1 Tax=Dictyocaulus viviparus TaxID=29172 RepID=A0A0D8XK00_DICVI|nr:hypothetical protein DICVIV_11356 [Dictyocaulus viviparus]
MLHERYGTDQNQACLNSKDGRWIPKKKENVYITKTIYFGVKCVVKYSLTQNGKNTVLMELLGACEKKSFNNISVSVILSWGIRAAELGFLYPSIPSRFEVVTAAVTRLLSRLFGDFHEENLKLINKLADLVQNLVMHLLMMEPTSSNDNVMRLHSYYSFLLNTDSILSQRIRGNWIASYCETRWKILVQDGNYATAMKIRRMCTAALVLCTGECANSVLFSIIPTVEQLIQVLEAVSSMGPSASTVFLTVFEIVGDLVSHHTKFPLTASVALLSVPWLTDPELQLQSRRHVNSLPLLKEMSRLAKINIGSASLSSFDSGDDVLVYTLSALSLVDGFCDWRRTILLSALSSQRSPLIQAALSHLSMFVTSLDAPSLQRLLIPAIELASSSSFLCSDVDMSCILNALSQSLCASHPNSVHSSSEVTCIGCQELVGGTPIRERDKIEHLPGLFELLIKVLTDHKYEKEKHVRLDAAGLLLAAICHVQCPLDVYFQVVKASLSFINDEDEDVRNVYQPAFKVIVSGPMPTELVETIFYEHMCTKYPIECEQTMMEASTPFLVVAARYSSSSDLSNRCIHQLLIRALRFLDSVAIFNDCKRTMLQLSEQEFLDSRDLRRFFARRKRAFCSTIINEMLSLWRSDSEYSDDVFYEEIDNMLQTVIELFSFETFISLLCYSFIDSSMYLIPSVLLSDKKNGEISYFPPVLEKPMNSVRRKFLKSFIKEYCDVDLVWLLYTKRYSCIVCVLQNIALDTSGYLEILQNIFTWQMRCNQQETFSLTALMKYNCEYLGFLLSFRRSLLDDDHYEQRANLLASFATIIKLIDVKFLEETCNKVIVVLRAATTIGEESVTVWTEFVRRLSDGIREITAKKAPIINI